MWQRSGKGQNSKGYAESPEFSPAQGLINTSIYSLFRPDPLPSRELETNTSKFNAAALY